MIFIYSSFYLHLHGFITNRLNDQFLVGLLRLVFTSYGVGVGVVSGVVRALMT